MRETELRSRLLDDPVPDELEAGGRAWRVVAAAYATRERRAWIERHPRLVVALAAAAALAVAGVTPPGRAVVERVRDEVAGEKPSEPALVSLPAPGRLLVNSAQGAWVVQEDGSKRLLGDYDDTSWSPSGLFVVATKGARLVTLEPGSGDVRWSIARPEPIQNPRWSGGAPDTRIAYRSGSSLHVVAGDGSPDAVVATEVAAVAPAWKGESHVLAYADHAGRVHVVDADARRELWRTSKIADVRRLTFTPEGILTVLTTRSADLYGRRGRVGRGIPPLPEGHVLLDAAPLPGGGVVYADYDSRTDQTALVREHCFKRPPCRLIGPSQVFQGAGRIANLTLSPGSRWLLAGWAGADQLLFFRLPRVGKFVAVDDVRREFDPGGAGDGAFPRLAGWAPAAP